MAQVVGREMTKTRLDGDRSTKRPEVCRVDRIAAPGCEHDIQASVGRRRCARSNAVLLSLDLSESMIPEDVDHRRSQPDAANRALGFRIAEMTIRLRAFPRPSDM